MKKLLKGLLACTMAIALVGCSSSKQEETKTDNEPKDLYDEIIDRGYIIVGTEGTYSPVSYHNENDELVGFDVEIAKVIAEYLGVEVKYSEMEWASIFTAMDAGKIDIVVNEVGWKADRAEKYDFSKPYAFSKKCILTKGDNTSITSFEDLEGKVAANEATSIFGETAEQYGATLDPVNAMAQSISEVIYGRADCTLNYEVSFADYMKSNPDVDVKIVAYLEAEPSSYVPVPKGNEKLLEKVNEALADAKESGKLKEISEKYYGVDITEG